MSRIKGFTAEILQRKGFNVDALEPAKKNKIANAQKVNVDGEKFASKLELYMYNLLKALKIPFLFQYEIVLQEGFRYGGAAVRPIKIIVDFYLPEYDILIDTKGFQLADNKIKFKMLKFKFFLEDRHTKIFLPKNKQECEALVNRLFENKKSGS